MRTFAIAAFLMLASAAPVLADGVEGTYDVKYEEVSTNCPSPLRYTMGKLEVQKTKTGIQVDIDRTPVMSGSAGKNGKISAKSKSGPTMLDGMNGTFSVAGKITPEGMLSFVMIGEYTAGGKALCSQSWNVVGSKQEAKPADPPKKKATDPMSFVPSLLTR